MLFLETRKVSVWPRFHVNLTLFWETRKASDIDLIYKREYDVLSWETRKKSDLNSTRIWGYFERRDKCCARFHWKLTLLAFLATRADSELNVMESLGKVSLYPAHLLHVSQVMWNSACISLANISVFVKRSNQSPWIQCQGYLVSAPRVFRDSSLISFLQLPLCV